MVPTERALRLVEHARLALGEIDKLLVDQERFDPARTQQTFKIGSPDYLAAMFMSSVVERFRRDAPQARLLVHALGPEYDFEKALAQGELDVIIGNWPEPPEHLHLSIILEDEIVCLMSSRHPLVRKGLTIEQYLRATHVLPMPYSVSQRGLIDTRLASLRVSRDARVVVQSFNLAPYLLPNTDLIFTTSRHFAQFYANLLPLAIVSSPIDFPRMRFYQLWHDRTHQAPGYRWLRGLLTEAGRRSGQGIGASAAAHQTV